MKKILLLCIVFLLAPSLKAMDNPFSYDTQINDCDVIKYNGEYYITGNWLSGDMYQSRNLTDWGERKHVFSWDNTWYDQRYEDPDKDIHGTHIAYDNGVFHLYAHMAGDIVHAVSNNVTGPYTEPVDAPFDMSTIDVKTFKDLDGSLHYYSTRFGGVSGNHNDYRSMSDYNTLTSSPTTLIWPIYDWELIDGTINEGSFVFRYRDLYYMLYNGNHTRAPEYEIGCVVADAPDSFSNSGKYPDPVLSMTYYDYEGTEYMIKTIGQPWVVDGLNGFEKWLGYMAKEPRVTGNGRTQRIDRIHFFDRRLYVDGPTISLFSGYHPGPAEPQLRSLFYLPNGELPSTDWIEVSPTGDPGQWEVKDNQAYQSSQSCLSFNLVNREPATHYLFEANLKMPQSQDAEDKAGVVAYYKDSNNWVVIGVDRSLGSGADNWYFHIRTDTVDNVVDGGVFGGSFDYSVYHKIRVERNGGVFRVLIDDVLPPNFSNIETDITDPGIPGLYSDHAAAYYDGVIYTIGWDEYDEGITGWSNGANDNYKLGLWAVGDDGIFTLSKYSQIFKGDLMPEYEFSTQIYTQGQMNGRIGVYAAALDQDNYIKACFDLLGNQFAVNGLRDGTELGSQTIGIDIKESYNLRVVKRSDKIIFFIDGNEVLTCNVSFPASQVGFFTENNVARYNGIMVYQISSGQLPAPWKNVDVGEVGSEGNAKYVEGAFTINGSGIDIDGVVDEFHFVYRELCGDAEISTRLVSNDYTNDRDKAAIMFRDGLADDAGMAMLSFCGDGKLQYVTRSSIGAAAQVVSEIDVSADQIWLKMRRIGDRFYCYFSYDGASWVLFSSSEPGFTSDSLEAGIAVCSHDNTRLNGAVFDHVKVVGCTPGYPASDLNMDCAVDLEDFYLLAKQWLEDVPVGTLADFDDSGKIDFIDVQVFVDDWLAISN